MANDLQFLDYETVPLNAGTTTSSVKFKLPASQSDNQQCSVYNEGTVTAFVAFGDGSATAVLPDVTGTVGATPVGGGETVVFTKNRTSRGADTCAAIVKTGNAQLYFTAGKGY
jgi:hypothetical protein